MKAVKITLIILFLISIFPLDLRGSDPVPILERIDRASDLWVYDSLIGLHDEILEGVELEGTQESRILLGIIDYWLSGYYWQKDKDSAGFYLEELVKKLEDVPEDKKTAEEWAFLGYSYNTLIPLKGFMKAPVLGKKSGEAYKRAFELDPKSPIVNLLRGISLFHTPIGFGGGAGKALKVLDNALNLYKAGLSSVQWGEKVAMLHKAMALKELGRKEEAIKVLDETLKKFPEFGWARSTLESWKKEEVKK